MDPAIAILLAPLAAVFSSVLTYQAATRATRTSGMLEWNTQLQAAATEARQEAKESNDRAGRIKRKADQDIRAMSEKTEQLESKLRAANRSADRLADLLATVQTEVWRAEPDITALRRVVGRPSTPGWPEAKGGER